MEKMLRLVPWPIKILFMSHWSNILTFHRTLKMSKLQAVSHFDPFIFCSQLDWRQSTWKEPGKNKIMTEEISYLMSPIWPATWHCNYSYLERARVRSVGTENGRLCQRALRALGNNRPVCWAQYCALTVNDQQCTLVKFWSFNKKVIFLFYRV